MREKKKKSVGNPGNPDYKIAAKLYKAGYSDLDIANYMGYSRQAISCALHTIRKIPVESRPALIPIEGETMKERAMAMHNRGIQLNIIKPIICDTCKTIKKAIEVMEKNPLKVLETKCKCGIKSTDITQTRRDKTGLGAA